MICFNSRTREGCDVINVEDKEHPKLFQFTHPRGVRPLLSLSDDATEEFQFTHPRGVRPSPGANSVVREKRFNSRTREGCDGVSGVSGSVSSSFQFTHPRGVRHFLAGFLRDFGAFQFTHPRGVRPAVFGRELEKMQFQFTHPRGVRRFVLKADVRGLEVSIHAPARGATSRSGRRRSLCIVSIHAPARGATAGMGRWLWSCLYRPAFAKVLKLSLLSGASGT